MQEEDTEKPGERRSKSNTKIGIEKERELRKTQDEGGERGREGESWQLLAKTERHSITLKAKAKDSLDR